MAELTGRDKHRMHSTELTASHTLLHPYLPQATLKWLSWRGRRWRRCSSRSRGRWGRLTFLKGMDLMCCLVAAADRGAGGHGMFAESMVLKARILGLLPGALLQQRLRGR